MVCTLRDYTVAPAPTFGLPPDSERRSLRVGQYAKLVFTATPDDDSQGERMWVEVTEVIGVGVYAGKLANDPVVMPIKCGIAVNFAWNNVVSILEV
jgi:hypothetical protein